MLSLYIGDLLWYNVNGYRSGKVECNPCFIMSQMSLRCLLFAPEVEKHDEKKCLWILTILSTLALSDEDSLSFKLKLP